MATGNKRQATNELALFPATFPAGTVIPFAGDTAPDGWAVCDGSTLTRASYVNLFNAIGTSWGEGDGSTTFHLPDLRGRFLRGLDNAAGRDPDAGSRTAANTGGNTGDAVGSIQDNQIQSHGHTYRASDAVGFATNSNYRTGNGTQARVGSINNAGGNETRPVNANVNYIIKL